MFAAMHYRLADGTGSQSTPCSLCCGCNQDSLAGLDAEAKAQQKHVAVVRARLLAEKDTWVPLSLVNKAIAPTFVQVGPHISSRHAQGNERAVLSESNPRNCHVLHALRRSTVGTAVS
jgi:hypothetical protein